MILIQFGSFHFGSVTETAPIFREPWHNRVAPTQVLSVSWLIRLLLWTVWECTWIRLDWHLPHCSGVCLCAPVWKEGFTVLRSHWVNQPESGSIASVIFVMFPSCSLPCDVIIRGILKRFCLLAGRLLSTQKWKSQKQINETQKNLCLILWCNLEKKAASRESALWSLKGFI